MQDNAKFPVYSASQLASLSPQELIDMMIADEDRVPRNVIDECARRSEEMVEHLAALADDDSYWQDEISTGKWWMLLHAVMILGLIQTDSAGQLLVKFMRRMSVEDDGDLQDWLAGYWPALFSNKPETTHPALLSLCEDREMGWYMRANAIEAYTATQHKLGEDALASALERLAGIAADEQEEWDIRMLSGNYLLDFPRPQYRTLLDDMAAQQDDCWDAHFSQDDVKHAYATMQDNPVWKGGFKTPWKFYLPQQIAGRQEQWAQEAAKQAAHQSASPHYGWGNKYSHEPYLRETPKVGRNDPCPCGSGKKYK